MEHIFHYKSDIQEIPLIRKNLAELTRSWALPPSESRQIEVIIEELFSNILRFAYEDAQEHLIEIRVVKEEYEIGIEIIDDGIPFNPLEYRSLPSSDPAESNAGGMGLSLVKTFSDSITYRRWNQKNHLQITKMIKRRP